jgi:hypothetical protein
MDEFVKNIAIIISLVSIVAVATAVAAAIDYLEEQRKKRNIIER